MSARKFISWNAFLEGSFFYFKKDFIYLFLEREEGRENERERNIDVREKREIELVTPLPCRTMPNQLSHTGQGSFF